MCVGYTTTCMYVAMCLKIFTLFSVLQVMLVGTHMVTYNIVRGSVPVYWTQPGIKYRPNPIVERSEYTCFEKRRWCSGREGGEEMV